MEITITVNPPQVAGPALARLLGKSGWGREGDYGENCGAVWGQLTDNILIVVALNEGGHIVGIARAFTDYATVTWLAELLVDPDYRNRGIGTRLLNEIIERTCDTAFYAEIFSGTEPFFKKFNLTPKPMLVPVSRRPMPLQTDRDR